MFSRILQRHCWDLVIFLGGITCKFNFLTSYRAIYIIYFIFDESWQFVFSEVVVTKFSFLIGCPFQVLWLEREGFSWYFFFLACVYCLFRVANFSGIWSTWGKKKTQGAHHHALLYVSEFLLGCLLVWPFNILLCLLQIMSRVFRCR